MFRDNIHRMSMQKLSWTDFFVQVSFLHLGMCLMAAHWLPKVSPWTQIATMFKDNIHRMSMQKL